MVTGLERGAESGRKHAAPADATSSLDLSMKGVVPARSQQDRDNGDREESEL